eukprot:gene8500-5968_t
MLAYSSSIAAVAERHCPSADVVIGEDEKTFIVGNYNYRVETIGKRYSQLDKEKIISKVQKSVAHKGDMTWKNPEREFYIIIYHDKLKEPEKCVFFAVLLTESCRCQLLSKYDLKKRPYIGTTSMPPEESVVMVNLCHVTKGSFTYDPFCGTGSILVAAAHFNAHSYGTDTDGRSMRGGSIKFQQSPQMQQQRNLAMMNYSKSQLSLLSAEEQEFPSMLTNFKLYGLRPPDRVRFNFSTWERGYSKRNGIFDAIISDPPYGIREPRKRIDDATLSDKKHNQGGSYLASYNTTEVALDLIRFAAEYLVIGGYLAFWYPTTNNYTDSELPHHPSLKLVSNIPQRLSLKFVRRLIVFRKDYEAPIPRLDRLACAGLTQSEDLRQLMDSTSLPENADYMQYRERVARRRDATTRYLNAQNPDRIPENRGNRRGRKNSRRLTQEQIVANRERNIRTRKEKHDLSKAKQT